MLLIFHWEAGMKIIMSPDTNKTGKEKQWNIEDIVNDVGEAVSTHLLFMHAWTGCDTTSSIYGKGEKDWRIDQPNLNICRTDKQLNKKAQLHILLWNIVRFNHSACTTLLHFRDIRCIRYHIFQCRLKAIGLRHHHVCNRVHHKL